MDIVTEGGVVEGEEKGRLHHRGHGGHGEIGMEMEGKVTVWEVWGSAHDGPPGKAGPTEIGESLHAVVGGFFGDDYVVDVGFAEARGGDADELAFFG
jgi:hypothetical protein